MTILQAKGAIKLQGVLEIYKDYGDRKVLAFKEENLITIASKLLILGGVYSVVTSDPVNRVRFGTGGCVDPAGQIPKAENPNATDLVTPVFTLTVTNVVNSSVPSVVFSATVDTGTGNSNALTEAGLITVAGNLFNVKNFPQIYKTSEFSLIIQWTIKIA